MASAEAVARRRANRAARRISELHKAEQRANGPNIEGVRPREPWEDIVDRRRRAVQKLVHKHYRDAVPHPIVLQYDYWLLRSMDVDIMRDEYRFPKRGLIDRESLVDPWDTEAWVWWSGLHYKQQIFVAAGFRAR
jgi:broad specificity phosphatase PhoE